MPKPFMQIGIEGSKNINRMLKKVETKLERKTARRALKKGLGPAAARIRKLAPSGKKKKLKKAVGSKVGKDRSAGYANTAKVGVNIGKKGTRRAPHAHLVILGTKFRNRKRIGGKFKSRFPAFDTRNKSTGSVKANDFVKEGFDSTRNQVLKKMETEVKKDLAKI